MNAINIFLASSGFIVAMLGFGVAIIRGLSGRAKSNGREGRRNP